MKEISIMEMLSGICSIPNIKTVYFGNIFGFSMDLYTTTLNDYIKNTKVTTNMIKCVVVQVVSALAYAQKNMIMHRDVKPQNILINNDKVALTDWGMATVIVNNSMKYEEEKEVQTLWYRCPEHLLNIRSELNNFTIDMWSVGIIIIEMIRGYTGFVSGESPKEVLSKILYYFETPNDNIKITKKISILFNNITIIKRKIYILESIKNSDWCDSKFVNFLTNILNINNDKRLTPLDALYHNYIHDNEYINNTLTQDMNELITYYSINTINKEYINIRHKYICEYDKICKKSTDVHLFALMIMYTDKLSILEYDLLNNIDENVGVIAQIVYHIVYDEKIEIPNLQFEVSRCKLKKERINGKFEQIITKLKFPLGMCSFVNFGYQMLQHIDALYMLYETISRYVLKHYDVYQYDNITIYWSIIKLMSCYKCNILHLSEITKMLLEDKYFKIFELKNHVEIHNITVTSQTFGTVIFNYAI